MNDKLKLVSDRSTGVSKKALRRINARIIEVDLTKSNGLTKSTSEPTASNVVANDPFVNLLEQGKIVEPPFDPLTLATLLEQSSELGQCVEAMETNIDATGHRFVPRLKLDDVRRDRAPSEGGDSEPEEPTAESLNVRREKVRLTNFFQYATDETFVSFRRKLRRDLESTGNAYFEVLRNVKGEVQGFVHVPSYQMRLGVLDKEARKVERRIAELQLDGSVQIKRQQVWRRFRVYAQSRGTRSSKIVRWFKSFGDPRRLDRITGEYETKAKPVPNAKLASEIVHLKLYSPRSPYGLPRYIGNLLSIFGDRAAEEINYMTFRNNNIPSMVVLASNGQLTQGSIDRIKEFVDSQVQGSDNYSKFLLIEAEPFGEEGEDGGQAKVEVKPLTGDQHKDALFQNYSSNNQDKIRRAFRLPPIFVGRSDDYTRATADSSRRLADEQVFSPERGEWDGFVNRILFPEMGVRWHTYKSNSPNTTDNSQLVKILAGAEKTGGMTPRIARSILEDVLGIDLPDFPKDFPADVPFSMTMAEAVKNKADPSEPGQQVTALKSMELIDKLTSADLDFNDDESILEMAKSLMVLNRATELAWRAKLSSESEGDGESD